MKNERLEVGTLTDQERTGVAACLESSGLTKIKLQGMIGEYRNEVSDKLIQIQHDKCLGLLFLINYTHTGGRVISIKGLSKISSKLVVYIYRKEANLLLELIQNFHY